MFQAFDSDNNAVYGEGARGSSPDTPLVIGYSVSVVQLNPGGGGDPWFTGFRGQRFDVHGQADRVYNVLSLPSLQLNMRFVEVSKAMTASEQLSVRQRQGKLISALRSAAAATGSSQSLPQTTAWSHAGLYMGEAGVQVSGQRLRVQSGAYETGFTAVTLDGVDVAVSAEAVQLLDGSTIRRPTSSVLEVQTAEVRFQLRNSDHFLNMHSAELDEQAVAGLDHIDGLLGQTASSDFAVEKSAAFTRHVEEDFVLPEGADALWSTAFAHNRYVQTANAS